MTRTTSDANAERLVREVLGPVQRFARRIAGAARAEDVVSETVLALLQAVREGRPPRRPLAYALGVAWRRAADLCRSEARRPGPLEDDPVSGAGRMERLSDLREWIDSALEALPSADVAILHLFYEEQLDYREIGSVLGTSAGSVGRRLHDARGRFAAALERLGEPERVPLALAFLPALSIRVTSPGAAVLAGTEAAVMAARCEPVSWLAGVLFGGWTMKKLGACVAALLLFGLGGVVFRFLTSEPEESGGRPSVVAEPEIASAAEPADNAGAGSAPPPDPIVTEVFRPEGLVEDPRTIAGIVMGPGRRPAVRATVRCCPAGPSGVLAPDAPNAADITDDEGRFTIALLMDGKAFDVVAEAEGHSPAHARTVLAGTRDLTLQLGTGFALSGAVRDLAGAPIGDAEVRFDILMGRELFTRRAKAGADGRYRLAALPRPASATLGICRVRASAPGFAAADGRFAAGEPDDDEEIMDFILSRGGTVTGRVLDAGTAGPVAGAEVVFWETAGPAGIQSEAGFRIRNPYGSRITARTTADHEGRFRLHGVPVDSGVPLDGMFRRFIGGRAIVGGVVASAPGRAPAGVPIGTPKREGEEQAVEIRLAPAGTINGRVVDRGGQPLAGYRVIAQVPDDNVPGGGLVPGDSGILGGTVVTGADGCFVHDRVPCPPDLAIPVRLTLCGCDLGLPGEKIVTFRTQPGGVLNAGDLMVAVDPPQPFDGVVLAEEGRLPLAGAVVRAAGGAAAITGEGGRFTVELRAITDSGPMPMLAVSAAGYVDAAYFRIEQIPRGPIMLVKAGFIRGRLLDQQGLPIPGSAVSLMGKDTPAPSGSGTKSLMTWIPTDASGEFFAGGLRPGLYRLGARVPWRTAPVPDLVTVSTGTMDAELRVTGIAPVASLLVDVVDATTLKAVESGVKAVLKRDAAKALVASQRQAGRFVFSDVEPGIYDLRIDAPGVAPVMVPGLSLEPGRAIDPLTVRVGAGAVLTGQVRSASGAPAGAGFEIEVRSEERPDERAGVATAADGTYELRGLGSGRWIADVRPVAAAGEAQTAPAPRLVEVAADAPVREDFDLVPAAALHVAFESEGAPAPAPPPGAMGIRPVPAAVWCRLRDARGRIRREERGLSLQLGRIAFQVPAGEYVLEFFDGAGSLATVTLAAPGNHVVRIRRR